MILNQTNLDYTKYCVVPFGVYVQANHESTKTRTLDAIYLRLAQNQQGGHDLMDLNSGQLISRNIVHEIPVTDVVIKAVENMAYQQGFKSLNFKNRHGVIYHDADWIAGVDYDDPDDIENENENEDEEYDNEEDKNEDQLEQYEELDEQLEHIDEEYDNEEDENEDQLEQYKNSRNNLSTSILKRSETS
jgi:Xaa-Pro aminopeptidase